MTASLFSSVFIDFLDFYFFAGGFQQCVSAGCGSA